MTAKVDPKLTAVLRIAAKARRPVEAYVAIRSPTTGSAAASAKTILNRVARKTHTRAVKSQYLELLDSIHVSAPAAFLRVLIQQPEVLAACPPPAIKQSAMIEPVDRHVVTDAAIDLPIRRGRTA